MNNQKVIAFDLDDVICFRSSEYESLGLEKYSHCNPNVDIIEIVNSLYNDGYRIIIYTARGMTQLSGNVNKIYDALYLFTTSQLKKWGVKYHELVMGKIHYDLLIDDKAINSIDIKLETIKKFLSE